MISEEKAPNHAQQALLQWLCSRPSDKSWLCLLLLRSAWQPFRSLTICVRFLECALTAAICAKQSGEPGIT
jgi:hypothetical protein